MAVTVTGRRARDTRTMLLEAARDVFTDVGYTEANVADVVARAGSSVGSMYHHFGGKADLYLALYDEHQSRQEARADAGVRQARANGEQDALALFVAGARAFLRGCWEERDLARLFLDGDGPPGFDHVARRRFREWVKRVGSLLRHTESHLLGEPFTLVLTTVISAAGREVALKTDEEEAMSYADDVLILLARIGRAG
jgi:AcrR family transcriptional regulator